MGNMSYCRFENTARDLRDCLNAIYNGEVEDLSSYEIDGLIELQRLCRNIVDMEEHIDDIVKQAKEDV